jgi:hypothetical protein
LQQKVSGEILGYTVGHFTQLIFSIDSQNKPHMIQILFLC